MSRAAENPGLAFNFQHRKKNGEIRDVEIFSGPITLGGQQLLHSIIQDVTERQLAEDALKESEEKYRTLFEQAQIGIYQTTPEGEILNANPAILQMLGFESLDELKKINLESKELKKRKPLRIKRLNQQLAMWRDENGNVCCIADQDAGKLL